MSGPTSAASRATLPNTVPPTPGHRFAHLVEVARARAEELGDHVAYRFLDDGEQAASELGFRELDLRARALAVYLRSRVPERSRVVLALPPGTDYIVAFWGCLYANVWAVPLYPPLNPKYVVRMLAVMRDCEAVGVLTLGPLGEMLRGFVTMQGLDPDQWAWLSPEEAKPELAPSWTAPALERDGVAFLQYTSGSTGDPKGVMVGHHNLMANSEGLFRSYASVLATAGCEAPIQNVSWLPPYHDAGLVDGVLQTVYAGKRSVLMSPLSFLEKPSRWLRAISEHRATATSAPSFGYEYATKRALDAELEGVDLSCLVCSVNAAEPLQRDVYEAFTRRFAPLGYDARGLTPAYGLAEATLLSVVEARSTKAYWRELDRERLAAHVLAPPASPRTAASFASHGTPVAGMRVAIVDPASRAPRAAGEVGEIWLGGSSVALGYWGRPEVSEATFRATTAPTDGSAPDGPYLRTGDFGFLGDDGALFVTGRMKDVVIVRGKNHYPQDLESTASAAHPALRRGGAAAFAVHRAGGAVAKDAPEGEAFVVVQEAKRGLAEADLDAALLAVRAALVATHGIGPHDVLLVEPGGVPKTSSGKTERFKAREQWIDGSLPRLRSLRELEAARGEAAADPAAAERGALRRRVERRMVAFLAEHADLDLEAVDRQASFESFGVDSVRAVEMMRDVERALSRKVPDRAMLEQHTIAGMAAFLADHWADEARAAAATPAEPEPGEAAKPVGFVVPRFDAGPGDADDR